MGESQKEALRFEFDSSVRLEFHGAKLSSDGGLLVYRESCVVASEKEAMP